MANEHNHKTPAWVLIVCACLALSQPLAIALTRYFAPEGAAPTGLHIPDSALFLYSMDMFSSGFESAYAVCQSSHGPNSIVYYAVPHLWLYGVLGALGEVLGITPFIFYGIANGLGAFIYLYAVFRFLEQLMPRQSRPAFLLFTLSGGFGGLLYLLSILAGWTSHPDFEAYFWRFAIYELVEGPHLLPITHLPRLYYTLALALGFGALTQFHKSLQMRCGAHAFYAWLFMFTASFLYFRLVVFLLGMIVCYLWAHPFWPLRQRVRHFGVAALPALLGGGAGAALLQMNPAVVENHLRVADMAMWLSPFLVTAFLHLILAAAAIRPRIDHLPPLARACVFGAVGYLGVYVLGFAAYQVYYGNILVARDAAVATRVSDPALFGFVAGALLSWRRSSGFANPDNWVLIWFFGFLVGAIAAFGQGWYLRFGPQRLELLLWLPLCILAAQGLQRMPGPLGKALLGLLVFLGTISVCTAVMFFQTPVGRINAVGPYAGWHTETMAAADARAMDALGQGTVLALPPASDVIVARRGNPVVFGIGSFNLSDYPFVARRDMATRFFDPATPDSERHAIAKSGCAHYVYCSATWPVSPSTLHALRDASWLEVLHDDGGATVFFVVDPTFGIPAGARRSY